MLKKDYKGVNDQMAHVKTSQQLFELSQYLKKINTELKKRSEELKKKEEEFERKRGGILKKYDIKKKIEEAKARITKVEKKEVIELLRKVALKEKEVYDKELDQIKKSESI